MNHEGEIGLVMTYASSSDMSSFSMMLLGRDGWRTAGRPRPTISHALLLMALIIPFLRHFARRAEYE
ncbi:hypothetical protein TMatcc_005658 [Talaromyces marneffei ATCC 18224]